MKMQDGCKDLVFEVEVHDVEEGEISDSISVEEVSDDDFKTKQTPPSPLPGTLIGSTDNSKNTNVKLIGLSQNSSGGGNGSGARVWQMRDMYGYKIASSTYNSGLYNLAWAQAVNNKPLDEVFVMMEDNKKNTNNDCNDSKSHGFVTENDKLVIDLEGEAEKEEGELEEGEIDLDSELVVSKEGSKEDLWGVKDGVDVNDDTDKKQLDIIMKELQNLSFTDADKSFNRVCSNLHKSVDSLQKVVLESSGTEKDNLAKLLLSAVKSVDSVFSSLNPGLKEQNKNIFSSLLALVMSLKPPLFSFEQLKEMEVIVSSLYPPADTNHTKKQVDSEFCLSNKGSNEIQLMSPGALVGSQSNFSLEDLKLISDTSKYKGMVLPLLDLHKDHDAESLPSPTRESSLSLPFEKGFVLGHGSVKPEWPVPRQFIGRSNAAVHPKYESDAVNAVSTYQQKFGHNSFFKSDELPSPTPSEDDTGSEEIGSDVSSSIIQNVSNPYRSMFGQQINSVNSSIVEQSIVSSAGMETTSGFGLGNSKATGPSSTALHSASKSSLSKSRDPRLRFANSNAPVRNINPGISSVETFDHKTSLPVSISSRKQKAVEDPVLDAPSLKRPRGESIGSRISENGGCLDYRGTAGMPVMLGNHAPVKVGNTANVENALAGVFTSSITSNLSVKESDKFQLPDLKTTSPVSNSATSLPVHSALSASIMNNPIFPSSTMLPLSSQSSQLNEMDANASTSLCTLLRDIVVNPSLWMNMIKSDPQKSSDIIRSLIQNPNLDSLLGPEQSSTGAPPNLSVLEQSSGGTVQAPSPAVAMEEPGKPRMKPRDPRRSHYNSLQKGGYTGSDQVKTSTSISSGVTVNTGILKQVDQFEKIDKYLEPGNSKNGTNINSEEQNAAPPRLSATWNDVEHLLEGFDDQQKAAIHRERSRRLEEQKKMFSAHKLCLVLDLDHTLLNSAKFIEVDPVHDEILRKKEEEDREKPRRHLFRFPHMAMWTKLRPGIWNFLDKASRLFELHLYTMGNKCYATEMAKLLDPKGDLFSGRVISRGDDGDSFDSEDRVPKTKDLEGVLGMESAVVIIDDSIRVWPHNKLNLIVVERYIYFPCSRRQFGLPGPSLLEIDHDERPEFGTLASSLSVIETIHRNFFAHQSLEEADVRSILASEQRKILAGCRVVFSRIFPVGESSPHMHPLWQTAEQFGAVCSNQIDDKVTHVVANSLGTDKVNWALSSGRFVVHPGWVEASALLYRRANENDFSIKPQ